MAEMTVREAEEILGLQYVGVLTDDIIKKALRSSARKFHPDVNGSDDAMVKVNLACETLKNARALFNHGEFSETSYDIFLKTRGQVLKHGKITSKQRRELIKLYQNDDNITINILKDNILSFIQYMEKSMRDAILKEIGLYININNLTPRELLALDNLITKAVYYQDGSVDEIRDYIEPLFLKEKITLIEECKKHNLHGFVINQMTCAIYSALILSDAKAAIDRLESDYACFLNNLPSILPDAYLRQMFVAEFNGCMFPVDVKNVFASLVFNNIELEEGVSIDDYVDSIFSNYPALFNNDFYPVTTELAVVSNDNDKERWSQKKEGKARRMSSSTNPLFPDLF